MLGRNRNACQAQKETIDVDKAWASHVDTIDNNQMRQHGRAQDDSNSGDKRASVRVGSSSSAQASARSAFCSSAPDCSWAA